MNNKVKTEGKTPKTKTPRIPLDQRLKDKETLKILLGEFGKDTKMDYPTTSFGRGEYVREFVKYLKGSEKTDLTVKCSKENIFSSLENYDNRLEMIAIFNGPIGKKLLPLQKNVSENITTKPVSNPNDEEESNILYTPSVNSSNISATPKVPYQLSITGTIGNFLSNNSKKFISGSMLLTCLGATLYFTSNGESKEMYTVENLLTTIVPASISTKPALETSLTDSQRTNSPLLLEGQKYTLSKKNLAKRLSKEFIPKIFENNKKLEKKYTVTISSNGEELVVSGGLKPISLTGFTIGVVNNHMSKSDKCSDLDSILVRGVKSTSLPNEVNSFYNLECNNK